MTTDQVEGEFELRNCQAPRVTITEPTFAVPPHSTDCHFHIFGPYTRYPLSPGRRYSPPEAPISRYLELARTLGIGRMVVVQPSVYGTDNRCTLDAVARFGVHRARAVAVIDERFTSPMLRRLDEKGVRGVRFNAVSGNGTPLDLLKTLARLIAPFSWHLQLYLQGEQILDLMATLQDLPVPVVLDHMGGVSAAKGIEHPEFRALLRLLEGGRAWVKLCGYRSSATGYPFADVTPMAKALIAVAPERCVWGTDWPHPDYQRTMPDDGELLDLLGTWAPLASQRKQILVDNPASLYGFPAFA